MKEEHKEAMVEFAKERELLNARTEIADLKVRRRCTGLVEGEREG